jgi:predicted cobalt transporter CbtA
MNAVLNPLVSALEVIKFNFLVLHPGILPKLLLSAIQVGSVIPLILQCDRSCEHTYPIQNRDFTSMGGSQKQLPTAMG